MLAAVVPGLEPSIESPCVLREKLGGGGVCVFKKPFPNWPCTVSVQKKVIYF